MKFKAGDRVLYRFDKEVKRGVVELVVEEYAAAGVPYAVLFDDYEFAHLCSEHELELIDSSSFKAFTEQ